MIAKTLKFGARRAFHGITVLLGTALLTGVFFFVLPLIQAISKPPATDLVLQTVDTANLPPPPPPPAEEEPEPEEEPRKQDINLQESAAPLDLSQLELALNPGGFGGWAQGDFGVQLKTLPVNKGEEQSLFSLAELDQKPRVIYQPGPQITPKVRKKAPGKVVILFTVSTRGKVVNPLIQKSTDPVFEKPALVAVKKWRFEPGKRSGKAVRFRMRVPVTFPEGL